MKATDLMIGDWVYLPALQKQAQVTAIGEERDGRTLITLSDGKFTYYSIEVGTLKPILITPDHIVAAGFRIIHEEASTLYYYADNSNNILLRRISTVYKFGNITLLYLHELQHLLHFYGIELPTLTQEEAQ